MALYNAYAHKLRKEEKESYEKLKESLRVTTDGKLHEHFQALEEMKRMEQTISDQKEEIEKFEKFFNMMSSLLPAKHVPPTVYR